MNAAEQEALDTQRIARNEARRRARYGNAPTDRERAEARWRIAGQAAEIAWPGINDDRARTAWRNDYQGGSLVDSIAAVRQLTPAQTAQIAALQPAVEAVAR